MTKTSKTKRKSNKPFRLAILTGGGDCPGLNAAIRAVTKSSWNEGFEVYGIHEGFWGLDNNVIRLIQPQEVSGILPKGGTILRSSRFNPFKNKNSVERCLKNFQKNKLDGLIVIGGDGSCGVALDFWKQHQLPLNAIPKTIDNDVYGTDRTIGFYTAVQTAVDAIDKLHTTAESHNFIMVIELMGRHCGFLAAYAGLAGGADFILVPEVQVKESDLIRSLKNRHKRGKNFSIVVVAEDAKLLDENGKIIVSSPTIIDQYGKKKLGGIGNTICDIIKDKLGYETRYTNLGYVQRGGSPSAVDRLLATSFGCAAVELTTKNVWGTLLAYDRNRIVAKDLSVVRDGQKQLPMSFYNMSKKFFR